MARLIDADSLKIDLMNLSEETGMSIIGIFDLINNAPTVEPRIEYDTDGQPYRLFMSGSQVVPDMLQGWRYEERPKCEEFPKVDSHAKYWDNIGSADMRGEENG